jgi:2-polyprenyl-3-methyl-5-hydroxy-6-metoxy-1,4-benzoquinol methylase
LKQNKCPLCEESRLKLFLKRSGVPVHQNLVLNSKERALSVTREDLNLVVCENCGFVFNQSFDLSCLSYGEDYDNTQSCSAYFDGYLDGLVQDLVERQGVRNCSIVEVGCGKGEFLKKLVNYPGANNKGFGFDPSYVGPLSELDNKLNFRTCYYDQSCTDIAADIVVCRHVIEHVPEPLELLRSVRAALNASPQARVFFETPCVEWIFRNHVIWDFFYEHCSLFTAKSLRLAFELTGFNVERVEHIFGDQYLWLEASVGFSKTCVPAIDETVNLALNYSAIEKKLCEDWLVRLNELSHIGKVALWGAGAKGATFANLVDPHCTLIECVVDLNPNKQGRFVPGTGHPIVAPSELVHRGVGNAILMNPNYREENLKLLEKSGIKLNLINWSK